MIFWQVSKRRLTTTRTRERNIRAKCFWQFCGIDSHLRHIPVRFRPRKKFTLALIDEHVKHGFIERGIGRVAMQFPIAIDQIDLDRAAHWLVSIDADGSVGEIRASFTIPISELDDVDVVTARRNKTASEITCEPARLKFELAWSAQRKKKRALAHAASGAHFAVAICTGGHNSIMKDREANVTLIE